MMKFEILVLFLGLVSIALCEEQKCREDEYSPGPNCGLEPTCPDRSSHAYPKSICDCWCNPDTFRKLHTNECVTLANCT
ncbi:hypothetical protein K1T71_004342 [Dendrolimus kikuchii]|uniref:Uncharacterized protein n=1 Tax=Dendrolimus kikuchii TaxID=765133 RepID=A0ACC1D7E5_9NEOP|nr:hypothetical protein K1T71_004342 [Dendrolimus kikuchii]